MYRLISTVAVLVLGCFFAAGAFADGDCGGGFTTIQFVRDDLAGLKKDVETAVAAIPKPQAPYGKANEHWDLPSYTCKDQAGFRPVELDYTSTWNTDVSMQKLGEQYQKELMAAQAKGDYEAMTKISQKMQAAAMAAASSNVGKSPIDINLTVNTSDARTIDPDSVIRDGEGFIAVRTNKDPTSGNESISMYFDPVALKNAHQLARFDLSGDFRVQDKLALLSYRVDMSGPAAPLERIIKDIDVSKVLGTLTADRKNLQKH